MALHSYPQRFQTRRDSLQQRQVNMITTMMQFDKSQIDRPVIMSDRTRAKLTDVIKSTQTTTAARPNRADLWNDFTATVLSNGFGSVLVQSHNITGSTFLIPQKHWFHLVWFHTKTGTALELNRGFKFSKKNH